MRCISPKWLMRSLLLLGVVCLPWQADVLAQDTVIPAGTIIRCTLDEPDFSSATASVGDPVVCHLTGLVEFGKAAFPRGSYLAGHLEAAKEPGHFFGKGYLRVVFDRIGFPDLDEPVPTKVIAARGFKVDRNGDIRGHGHATRDAVEWMLPPLWPIKVLTLPARGPRPTLKGEEQLTLRLMDDVAVPRMSLGLGWHYFGGPSRYPASYAAPAQRPPVVRPRPEPARAQTSATESASPATGRPLTLIATRSSGVYAVRKYEVDDGHLNYTLNNGKTGSLTLADVDWTETSRLNVEQRNAAPPVQTALSRPN